MCPPDVSLALQGRATEPATRLTPLNFDVEVARLLPRERAASLANAANVFGDALRGIVSSARLNAEDRAQHLRQLRVGDDIGRQHDLSR